MVQTRSSTKKLLYGSNEAHNTSSEQDASAIQPAATNATVAREGPPRKRQRKVQVDNAKSKTTQRNEKEKTSPKLNLDTLFLIAEYLHPLDLLTLARTCKSIRELLMDKSSTFVWKAARRQMKGLPNCPLDLSEPEYANLVFYARCHNCGKAAQTILWAVRRRYCPMCRPQCMRPLSSSWTLIRGGDIIPAQWVKVNNVFLDRIDKEQLKAFKDKYERSSDKTRLIDDMRKLCRAILEHAKEGEAWDAERAGARGNDMARLRDKRQHEIRQCLKNHGYAAEVTNTYAWWKIQNEYVATFSFRSAKPLTKKEWQHMRPEWIEAMEDIRALRLERDVYRNRRQVLQTVYNRYLVQSSTLAEPSDIFPHMEYIATLPPFERIIKAPEETVVNADSFEAAFGELPAFVPEWRKKVDTAVASLVEIPPDLSSDTTTMKSRRTAKQKKVNTLSLVAKLNLACAVFHSNSTLFKYPELLLFGEFRNPSDQVKGANLPAWMTFCKTASYVVHACGLDPHVATVEDMENRNPLLICLDCDGQRIVRTWKNAICHAQDNPHHGASPHWQLVDNQYLGAIHAVEQREDTLRQPFYRCLLCKPRAGDARWYYDMTRHLDTVHGMKENAFQRGVHYETLDCGSLRSGMVEMVEEGNEVKFKAVDVKV